MAFMNIYLGENESGKIIKSDLRRVVRRMANETYSRRKIENKFKTETASEIVRNNQKNKH